MKTLATFGAVVLVAFVLLAPELAAAAPPFVSAGAVASNDVLAMLTPWASLVVLAVGVMCFVGRIPWGYFGAVALGFALVFGKDQVVPWIRGFLGV